MNISITILVFFYQNLTISILCLHQKGILAIYPALVNGGIYIVDDYNEYKACSNVIDEFFIINNINPEKLQKNVYRPYWIK